MRRFWCICLLFFAATSTYALEVQDVKWGFDGEVVPYRFNLVSVLFANPSDIPFDGTVNLYKSQGLKERVGAIYRTPCYLSPMTTRWVQFYVYIENQYDNDTWRLEWGSGPRDFCDLKDSYPPKCGSMAQVLLGDPETTRSVSAFKLFPEELFPPTGAGTGGLDSVLLDHSPRWEQAKRQAFVNWLQGGGKVHLLMDTDGHYPVFSDELSVLNISMDSARIGAGLVVRHPTTVGNIRKQDIQEGQVPLRQFKPEDQILSTQTSDSFFRALAQLSRPRYSWGWIYLLAVTYVALVGPGNLRAGRKLRDYRLRIVLLLATVAGFTWLFNVVGRHGQGEASVIHTLSYARAIDGNTYDVTQWINVFATRGADYTITHAAPDNLYASGQDFESVNGWIASGKDGRFVVDIPMFSRRALLHEAEMKGAHIPVEIVNWDGTGTLRQLTLTAGPDFTKQILDGWIVQGDRVYMMKRQDGRLQFGTSGEQPLSSVLSPSGPQYFGPGAYYGTPYGNENEPDVEGQFRKLATPLIGWALSTKDFTRAPSSATAGRAQLFLFARSPDSFCVSGSQFGREVGYVLYHFDLFKPGS